MTLVLFMCAQFTVQILNLTTKKITVLFDFKLQSYGTQLSHLLLWKYFFQL
jgi:hypothetical protein